MATTSRSKKIIWAVNPFEEKGDSLTQAVSTLRNLSLSGAEIEPVYILTPDAIDLGFDFKPSWLVSLRASTLKAFEAYLADIKMDGLLPPRIIVENKLSASMGIQALIRHAKKARADLIAISSHGRGGLPRLFLGSFAETLLLRSPLPTLVIGPHARTQKIKNIFFATDFSKSAGPVFRQVLDLAKTHQASVTLFHAVSHPFEPAVQSGTYLLGGGLIFLPDMITRTQQKQKKNAERYGALAKKMGIELQIRFEHAHEGIVNSILEHAASSHADLIAMAAQSGPIAATLMGSITRQIVRMSDCPVWVINTR